MKTKKLATVLAAFAVLATPFLTSVTNADTSTSSDVFFSKSFPVSDLVDGKVLQQNPYVVVSSVSGGAVAANDPYVYVLEYVGKENDPTNGELTYWKGEQVNVKTGDVMSIPPNIGAYPVKFYPELTPPSDGQGVDFGTQVPANAKWATGSGLNTTPIQNWNPQVKGNNLSGFSDVPDTNPNAAYIADLKSKGLIDGTGNGNFSPNNPLTREQFAKMIVGAFGVPSATALPFADVTDSWAKPYVAAAYTAGITKGTGSNTFSPNQTLTREEAATMVWRWLASKGISPASNASQFDNDNADTWAQDSIRNVKAYGFRAGGASNNTYNPKDTMYRGDAAALIDLAMKKLQGN